MVGEAGMPESWMSRSEHGGRSRRVVALENIDTVGLALARTLLGAGYGVVAGDVPERYLPEFRAAGGVTARAGYTDSLISWTIRCHERPGVRPELLRRLSSARQEYRRPRLELSGSHRSMERHSGEKVATLVVRSGPSSDGPAPLHVDLDVSSRGLQLIVRGERPLFEAALPLLTVLADRVLYAGIARDDTPSATDSHPPEAL